MTADPKSAALDYQQANPLGGPAKVFRAMADAIEAGDSYEDTLRRYGYAEAQAPAEVHGDERAALERLTKAVEYELDPDWGCESYHPSLAPALKQARAALSATQPKGTAPAGWQFERAGDVIKAVAPDGVYWCVVRDDEAREDKIGAFFWTLCDAIAPAPLTSVCHMECDGCISSGKCAHAQKARRAADHDVWMSDYFTLLGDAEIRRSAGETDMPAYLLELAGRIAKAHLDEGYVQRAAELRAAAPAQAPAPAPLDEHAVLLAAQKLDNTPAFVNGFFQGAKYVERALATPAPAVGADAAKDAARFRWLIDERNWNENEDTPSVCTSEDVHWGNKARALIDRHMETQPPVADKKEQP